MCCSKQLLEVYGIRNTKQLSRCDSRALQMLPSNLSTIRLPTGRSTDAVNPVPHGGTHGSHCEHPVREAAALGFTDAKPDFHLLRCDLDRRLRGNKYSDKLPKIIPKGYPKNVERISTDAVWIQLCEEYESILRNTVWILY